MFPDFNIYSTPLLILVIQGVLLALMLFNRFRKEGVKSDLILGFLLLISCYHRTTYTIGFMGWYDTFRNTKVNYYLIQLSLAVGPLIYFYVKSSVQRGFTFNKNHLLHFFPVLFYVVFMLSAFLYDRTQSGFYETQNGPFYLWMMDHLFTAFSFLFAIHLLFYLVFSFQLYYAFRKQLIEEYSNTYKFELRWLRNFLYVFTFLFIYDAIQMITDGYIFDLHWTQEWWFQFCSVLIVIYVGLKGYFTPIESLKKINLDVKKLVKANTGINSFEYKDELKSLCALVASEKIYLDPNLSLSQLSRMSKINTSQLSYMINAGLSKNFNDFINEYRVEEVKKALVNPEKKQFSVLSIAYDSGFNSKATFNRVFKRLAGKSPSDFRK